MGRWAKLKLSFRRVSRTLSRAYTRLVAYRPSVIAIALLGVAAAIFLFGGGLYDIVYRPVAALPRPGTIWIAYPFTLLEQTLLESIEAMILFALGFAGVYLIYDSTKYAEDPYRAGIRFVTGVALLLLAYFACRYLLTLKMRPTGLS